MAREPQNPGIHRHLFDNDSCIPATPSYGSWCTECATRVRRPPLRLRDLVPGGRLGRRLEVGNLPLPSLPPCRTRGFGDRQRLSTPNLRWRVGRHCRGRGGGRAVILAAVGHCNSGSSDDFLVVGAYLRG